MVILGRTGNTWRLLSWDAYESELKKDGNFSMAEKAYYEKVIDYCLTAQTARLFSPAWKDVAKCL